jgi:hypothetical protein
MNEKALEAPDAALRFAEMRGRISCLVCRKEILSTVWIVPTTHHNPDESLYGVTFAFACDAHAEPLPGQVMGRLREGGYTKVKQEMQ